MLNFLIYSTVFFWGFGFLAAVLTLRDTDPRRHFLWSVTGAVSFVAGAAFLIALLRRTKVAEAEFVWVTVVLLVVGLVFWGALIFTHRGYQEPGERTLKSRVQFAFRVALPGWKDLDTQQFRSADKKDAGRISTALNIGAVLVVIPGVALVLTASIIMNINSSETSDFISHAVGYYALLVATCWTLTYLVTISLVVLFQIIRGNGRDLTVSRAAVSVGTWAGFGAAGGVFVGALVPLIVVPLASGHYDLLGVSLLDSVSPSLLLDISAAGAVFGFLLGEVVSLVSISAGESNLYLKAVAAPLVFASSATLLGQVGFTPGKLSDVLGAEYRRTVLDGVNTDHIDPFKTAMSTGLDSQKGWAMAVSAFEESGWNHLVDQHIYYLLTWIVAVIVALFAFAFEVRSREEKLLIAAGEINGKRHQVS